MTVQRGPNGHFLPVRTCHNFNTAQGCRYGEKCKFKHVATKDLPSINNSTRPTPKNRPQNVKLMQWRYKIPLHSSPTPLPRVSLQKLLQEALELVTEDAGTMQETVRLLASEGGLIRVKEMIDLTYQKEMGKIVFVHIILPLLQLVTHSKVITSIMVENHLGTVYNFLYGRQGERANHLFAFITQALTQEPELICPAHVETITFALSNVVDWNGHAIINADLKITAETFLELVNFAEMEDPRFFASVGKLSARLELATSLPDTLSKHKPIDKAKFHLPRDLPGSLSLHGSRHDNDHDDIGKILIMPTLEEVMASRSEYLPTLDIEERHLSPIKGLLDRNFRFLREDTIGLLRDAVRQEMGQTDIASQRSTRTFTYHNVVVEQIEFSRHRGLSFLVRFEQPRHLLNRTAATRKEWWEHTRRLQTDALICLLTEGELLIFCTVGEPEGKQKPSEKSSDQTQLPSLFKHPQDAYVLLQPVDLSASTMSAILMLSTHHQAKSCKLIEFPGVLLPSFQPTLLALQKMSGSLDLSLVEYIDYENNAKELKPPFYATRPNFRYNLKDVVTDGSDFYLTPGEHFDMEAFKANTSLDSAQAEALFHTLSRRLGLIQGPPGTGKSYTGVALIKVLLRAKRQANLGPILCVCYTNHALDQLLEHLLDNGVEQIIRIGSRSKSERLEKCNLRTIVNEVEMTREERQENYRASRDVQNEVKEIQKIIAAINYPHAAAVIKAHLEDHHPVQCSQLFSEEGRDEDGYEIVDYHKGQEASRWLSGNYEPACFAQRSVDVLEETNIHEMSQTERSVLYQHWISKIQENLQSRLIAALDSYYTAQSQYRRVRSSIDLRCLEAADVIGVTTTGLARQLELLRKLPSKVLVCEEAGEVLEAHILTALLPSIQHAILIGDHQQLRPQIQNYDLSRENPRGQQYSHDMSLFERLVQPLDSSQSALPFSVLETQRRMHPSISNLIRTTLYPQLKDSPNVKEYPEISGMKKRLFWLDHGHLEDGADHHMNTTSHSNQYEINMVVALVTHLMRQGVYTQNEIAVLTPYLGQLLKIRRTLAASFEVTMTEKDISDIDKQGLEIEPLPQRPTKTSLLKSLKVATVDNFQGEEAKVVIISLVRSNTENKCGFLKTSNRINVLLSRAMHGMYIIGNATTSGHINMWADVIDLLKADDNFGSQLALKCPRHPETPILVSTPDNFVVLSPEGGCNLKCDRRLLCGHACINKCHSPTLHNAVRCLEDCPRSLKGCEHGCPNRCGDPCIEKCAAVNTRSRFLVMLISTIIPALSHVVSRPLVAIFVGKSARNVNLVKTESLFQITTALVSRPVDALTLHVVIRVVTFVMKEVPVQAVRPSVTLAVATRNATRNAVSLALLVLKSVVLQHVLTKDAPCHVQVRVTTFPAQRGPTICGEICPPPQFCQICADAGTLSTIVDFIMMSEYSEHDLNEEPCIIPPCGHILTVSSMDGHLEMSEHYEMDGIVVLSIKDTLKPFSMKEIKYCPKCRGPLRILSRYGRIVRRALLDQSSKRFITWAYGETLRLLEAFHDQQKKLEASQDTANIKPRDEFELEVGIDLELTGSRETVLQTIKDASDRRYRRMIQVRNAIVTHLAKVAVDEQPFKRVWDLVQHARRRCTTTDDLAWIPDMVQVGESLRVHSLLFRCDLAIIADYLSLKGAVVDLGHAKQECVAFSLLAQEARMPLHEVEGHIFYARFCAMERTSVSADRIDALVIDGKNHLEEGRKLCQQYVGSTRAVVGELEEVEVMLQESTFYSPVKDDEFKAILEAMRKEMIGTGHWYTCENGHPFAVGECGRPMAETVCPECGSPVGGQHHVEARGVRRAHDLERRLDALSL